MKNKILALCTVGILMVACSPSVPRDAEMTRVQADIYPDYVNVTIPCNIAPLNFEIKSEGDAFVTHVHARGVDGFVVDGQTVDMDVAEWHQVLAQAAGDSVFVDIYARQEGVWKQYPAVRMAVAEEIDPYITYRLIEPSYVNFEVMSINQRSLESFDENEIYDNQPFEGETTGQCINCHNSQNYNKGGRWQMHIRLDNGGTLMADNDKLTKLNLKLPETISAGVYPAWHPTLPLIVYSNNKTDQSFHLTHSNKIEVQDNASDLILYDVGYNEVSIVANDSTEWETFPAWSPDGKWLYYVSATIRPMTTDEINAWRNVHYKDIKYNIYRRSFDASTRTFGAPDTVYMATQSGGSATLPRISPDGRYLLFAKAAFGTFHIWHHDADLWLIDLESHRVRPLVEVNSTDTESYHSWSSNSRWILFSSRRDDGSYTRLYIAYFDRTGYARKPFLLPQRRPQSNALLFKSYNVPEFIVQPIKASRRDIINVLQQPALDVVFGK